MHIASLLARNDLACSFVSKPNLQRTSPSPMVPVQTTASNNSDYRSTDAPPTNVQDCESDHLERDLPPTISRAIHRIITWRHGLFDTLNTATVRNLLCEIVRCASWIDPEQKIFIANDTLADRLNVSVSTIKRGLHWLMLCGWIDREQTKSVYNKFIISHTWLTPTGISSLGLDRKPDSLFFRGSSMSHTIGDLDIQSFSKRQPDQQIADDGFFQKNIQSKNQKTSDQNGSPKFSGHVKLSIMMNELAIKEKPPSTEPTPVIRSLAPDGQVLNIPKTLAPLLKRMSGTQVCRLMRDASLAGHKLEDISITCEATILKSRNPMAYIRRLIACNRDWTWIRHEKSRQLADNENNAKASNEALIRKNLVDKFIEENEGATFTNSDNSRTYNITSGYCTATWIEYGAQRQGAVLLCEKFIDAVRSQKLRRINHA